MPVEHRAVRETIPVPRQDFPVIIRKTLVNRPQMIFGGHFHPQFELLYIKRGKLSLCCNKTDLQLEAGQLAVLNPYDIHTAYSEKGLLYYYCVILDPNFLGGGSGDVCSTRYIQPFAHGDLHFSNVTTATAPCKELFERLVNEYTTGTPGFELAIKADLLQIFLELYRTVPFSKLNAAERQIRQREGKRFQVLFQYLDNHYNQNITLDQMAEIANYSMYYFSRLFHRLTGKKPMEYLRNLRLQKSMELLLSGMSVSETAMHCGFNSPNYFSKIFREEFGQAPSAFLVPPRDR